MGMPDKISQMNKNVGNSNMVGKIAFCILNEHKRGCHTRYKAVPIFTLNVKHMRFLSNHVTIDLAIVSIDRHSTLVSVHLAYFYSNCSERLIKVIMHIKYMD